MSHQERNVKSSGQLTLKFYRDSKDGREVRGMVIPESDGPEPQGSDEKSTGVWNKVFVIVTFEGDGRRLQEGRILQVLDAKMDFPDQVSIDFPIVGTGKKRGMVSR